MDDVVTFPGRMYAFVNYRTTEEAVGACGALQDQAVQELTGGWAGGRADGGIVRDCFVM